MGIKKYLNKTLISQEGLMFRMCQTGGSIENTLWKDLYSETYYVFPDFIIEKCEIIENSTISIF